MVKSRKEYFYVDDYLVNKEKQESQAVVWEDR